MKRRFWLALARYFAKRAGGRFVREVKIHYAESLPDFTVWSAEAADAERRWHDGA